MQINFDREFKDLAGATLRENDKPVTLASIAANALLATYQHETIDGDEKARRWNMARRIFENKEAVTLSLEEAATIKKLIGMAFGPLIVGQAFVMLES